VNFNSCLYVGQVFHKRSRPKQHSLKYSVFTLFADLAELKKLHETLWLFSYNRFNLFSFKDKDFGEIPSESLKDYVERKLLEAGIHKKPDRIFISCYPRLLGYVFNPKLVLLLG